MLTIQQCREILEKDHPEYEISDEKVEQIRDFFYQMAEFELEPLLVKLERILNTKD